MSQIYVVGIPITKHTISQEFLNILKRETPTVFLSASVLNLKNRDFSNDYLTAGVGYDLLISSGLEFTDVYRQNLNKCVFMMNLWYKDNKRRGVKDIAGDLIFTMEKIIKEQGVDVVYLVPGSPNLYDSICPVLMRSIDNLKVIDTKSSAQIIYELFNEVKPLNIVDCYNIELKQSHVNTLGCMGEIYSEFIDTHDFFDQCKNFDRIYDVKLGSHIKINQLSYDELNNKLIKDRKSLNDSTLVIL